MRPSPDTVLDAAAGLDITRLTKADIPAVIEIERVSYVNPWSEELFLKELENPISHAYAAREKPGEPVAGYIVFWIVAGEAHILNLAVAPEKRRRAVARGLLAFAVGQMMRRGVTDAYLEVRVSNLAARRLYEDFNFKESFIREKYYGDEDAIVMRLELLEKWDDEF